MVTSHHLLSLNLVTADPNAIRLRLLKMNDFENTTNIDPWYDMSPGDVNWRLEGVSDLNKPTPLVPDSLNPTSAKYMRVLPSNHYVNPNQRPSGLAILRSKPFMAYPTDSVEFSFWIRSKFPQGNNLQVHYVFNQTENVLLSLSSFSTVVNSEWRTASAGIPVTSPMIVQIVFYAYCGPQNEDAVTIDDIIVKSSSSFSAPSEALRKFFSVCFILNL